MQRLTGERVNITESKAIQCIKGKWYLLAVDDGFKRVGELCVKPGRPPLFLDSEEAKNFAAEVKGKLVFAGNDTYVSNMGVYVVKLFDARSVFEKYGPGFALDPDDIKIIRSR